MTVLVPRRTARRIGCGHTAAVRWTGPPAWSDRLQVTTQVLAALGVLIFGIPLILNLLFWSHHNTLGFGRGQIGEPLLSVMDAVLIVVLLAVALRVRGRPALALPAAALGLAGTVFSTYGLVVGGAAGPAPAVYWWLLLAVGLATYAARPH